MNVKNVVRLLVIGIFCASCNQDDDPKSPFPEYPEIGATYDGETIRLEFIDSTTVNFLDLSSSEIEGTAKYAYRRSDGRLHILNSYGEGHRVEPDKVDHPYFLYFEGHFLSKEIFEAEFYLVGAHEKTQVIGGNEFHKISDK